MSEKIDGIASGQQRAGAGWSQNNDQLFAIQQQLSRMQTSMPVRVEKCTNNGGLSPVGFVDVTPLVNQIDGQGNATPHTVIFNLPYSRLQGGKNAVIIDPKEGDIGIAIFASRDISKVKATKKAANPGSFRKYSFSDGQYIGGILNAVPEQYILFDDNKIKIYSPNQIIVEAEKADVIATSEATVTAPAIKLGASGQTLMKLVKETFVTLFNTHTHTKGGGTSTLVPDQLMDDDQLTSTITGG